MPSFNREHFVISEQSRRKVKLLITSTHIRFAEFRAPGTEATAKETTL